jgi:ribosome hibernation promoting factor
MPFRVSGKNIDIGGALRERVNARIAEAVNKYFHGGYSGHVTVERDGFGFRTDCVIHLDSGIVLEAGAMAADAYASADQAAIRIEKRLRRYKRRLKDRHAAAARGDGGGAAAPEPVEAQSYVIAAPEQESEEEEVTEFSPVIIAESTTRLKRLPVSEAVLELDLTGAPVVVFRHDGHGRVNVVYRRPDGHIGWIDPPALIPDNDH